VLWGTYQKQHLLGETMFDRDFASMSDAELKAYAWALESEISKLNNEQQSLKIAMNSLK
jgi:hypothetical protein